MLDDRGRPAQGQALADAAEIDRRVGHQFAGADALHDTVETDRRSHRRRERRAWISEPLQVAKHPWIEPAGGDPVRPVRRDQGTFEPARHVDRPSGPGRLVEAGEVARRPEPGHLGLGRLELCLDGRPGPIGRTPPGGLAPELGSQIVSRNGDAIARPSNRRTVADADPVRAAWTIG